MNADTRAKVKAVVKSQVALYIKRYRYQIHSVEDINCGFCFHFAMILKERLADELGLESVIFDTARTPGHSILKVKDLYFDSEAPMGVKLEKISFSTHRGLTAEDWTEVPDPLHPPRESWRFKTEDNGLAYYNSEYGNGLLKDKRSKREQEELKKYCERVLG